MFKEEEKESRRLSWHYYFSVLKRIHCLVASFHFYHSTLGTTLTMTMAVFKLALQIFK